MDLDKEELKKIWKHCPILLWNILSEGKHFFSNFIGKNMLMNAWASENHSEKIFLITSIKSALVKIAMSNKATLQFCIIGVTLEVRDKSIMDNTWVYLVVQLYEMVFKWILDLERLWTINFINQISLPTWNKSYEFK